MLIHQLIGLVMMVILLFVLIAAPDPTKINKKVK